ncbi:PAS domain S-box protein [Cryomorpha ignava]|uniref:PAS domain S-box protein n=1 Tax=Cryomorpha ignava TaxID=101383 RepID=A0A7K3WKF6_9FLAO|nr:PAS domain S-box protein [Cryomorpha ignava]NEN22133.1 PAS domain S-box protein [Cryomorpha ignava]
MSKKPDFTIEVDRTVIGYADSIKMPAWIYNLDERKVVYHNKASKYLSRYTESLEESKNSFENLVKEKIDESLGNQCFLVSEIFLNSAFIARKFQIIVNRLSPTQVIITFLEFEPSTNFNSFKTTVLFCNQAGEITWRSKQSYDKRFDEIDSISDLLGKKDSKRLGELIKNSLKSNNSEVLPNVEVSFENISGEMHIECISFANKTTMVGLIFSDAQFQSELILEKSRAELAEEINEILKLEISEHKKTQQKLEETEYLSSTILNSSLNIILTFSKEQKISEFNKKAQEITGYSRDEVLGKEIDLILENVSEVKNVISSVNDKGYFEGELLCIKKDGSKFGVFAAVSLLKNNVGESQGYVCSLRDISEIKKWREIAAITEERYTDLFENATDLIQGVRKDGTFIYTNKSWYKHLDYTTSERDELKIFDLIIPKERKEFKKHFSNILNGEETQTRKWTLKGKKGKVLIVESIDNLKLKNGKPHTVRSVMRDITAASQAEHLAREQSAKVEAIIESGNIMFWTVNKAIKLTSFNNEYAKTIFKLYGKLPILDKGKGELKDKFAPKEYHSFWDRKYNEVFRTGKPLFFQTKTKDKQGIAYYREIYLRPIRSNGKNSGVTEVAGTGLDITDKKLTERKINEQTSKIQTIFDSTNHMIWSLDTKGKLTSFNNIFRVKLKERYGIDINVGDDGLKIAREIKISLKGGWNHVLARLKTGERLQIEIETKDREKKHHIDDISISPIYNDDGEIVELAGMAQTVTFKKAAEKKLKDQAAKINAIFNSTAMLMWTLDKNMRIVAYNKVFADKHFKMLGSEVGIGSNFLKTIQSKVAPESFEMLQKYYSAAFSGADQQFEGVLYSVDGEKKWMETFLNPIYSENNEIKEISCLSHEITDKKIIQEQMRESIHEKEILLQEVHHRVKNNLQVISSILNLQSSYVKDENSLSILRESQNRIKSMSFIHESLYQTKDFSNIEFSDYIFSLSKNLIHSYSLAVGKVKLITDFERTHLSLDQAIPCGLIANELISNALKYAFIGDAEGEISLSIKENEGKIVICIADNGIGLPKDLDYENSDSLGLQLVYTLIDQLDATIKVDTSIGTKYLITFDKQ